MMIRDIHKRLKPIKIILCILFLAPVGVFAVQADEAFERGNALYQKQDYQEAIFAYEEALKGGSHSAALYFNLGNSYYKLNKVAQSIYFFEKARLLDPNDADILNNLRYARQMTIDDIEPLPVFGLSKFASNITGIFTVRQWAWASVLTMILCVSVFIVYLFSRGSGRKRLAFSSSMFLLLVSLGMYSIGSGLKQDLDNEKPAIVFASEVQVKAEPNLSSQTVFTLHEGTKTWVLTSVGNWHKIRLADGKLGWLPDNEVRLIKDF